MWKTCGRSVDLLLINGQSKKISGNLSSIPDPARAFTRVSYGVSLERRVTTRRIHDVPDTTTSQSIFTVPISVHRFEECIGGRAYLFEVAAVDPDRWRAYIAKAPGVPTALMPFYGPTPGEAAELLRRWLTRAHERVGISRQA
jgi:hypothetical protein